MKLNKPQKNRPKSQSKQLGMQDTNIINYKKGWNGGGGETRV